MTSRFQLEGLLIAARSRSCEAGLVTTGYVELVDFAEWFRNLQRKAVCLNG